MNCDSMSRTCTAIHSSSPPTVDRTRQTEFEAAEVLAHLFSSTPEASIGGAGESVDSWGGLRVKTESSPVDSGLNSVTIDEPEKKPVILAFDLNEDQSVMINQEDSVKSEDAELAEPPAAAAAAACTASLTGGKSKRNLTEADKEARRLRRVLANRESARQTIRRRQALYENLTRKVADLGRENENLKRVKESAVEEYEALKCTNTKLKEQVTEQVESKLEKTTSAQCSFPPLQFANYPYIICPYPPESAYYGESEAKLTDNSNSEAPNGKGKPIRSSSGHWYMVPYPVFFPMPEGKNGPNLIPFFPAGDKENEGRVVDACSLQSCTSQADVRGAMGQSEAISSQGVDVSNVLQEEGRKHGGKRVVDPAAAAEARKRRKALTKMKSMHCRAHRKEGLRLGESHHSLSRNA